MRSLATLDLDRHVREAGQRSEAGLVLGGRPRVVGDQRDHGGVVAGTDPPQVQVADAIPLRLQPLPNGGRETLVGNQGKRMRSARSMYGVPCARRRREADTSLYI